MAIEPEFLLEPLDVSRNRREELAKKSAELTGILHTRAQKARALGSQLAAFAGMITGLGGPVSACSAFVCSGPDEVLLAKNFDWHFGGGYLVTNPIGVAGS
jgi:hypothetical protein